MAPNEEGPVDRPDYSRDLWIGAGLDVAAWVVSILLPGTAGLTLSVALALIGLPLWLRGCIRYAVSKGWHWAVGLLGLFMFIGLLVIWQLPTMPTRRRR